MWGTEPRWFLRQTEENEGKRGPQTVWGACGEDHEDQEEKAAVGVEGWIVLGSVQPTSQSGERCLEGRPHPPERHGSALPTLPCAPRQPWNQPRWWTAVVEKLWRSEIRSVSSFGEIRATHASPLGKSSVFILLSWRQRPSGGNVRDPPGQWPDGQSIWMYMKWSLPTLRCEVPGHGIMHAVQILLISHWGGKLDARGGERPCTL